MIRAHVALRRAGLPALCLWLTGCASCNMLATTPACDAQLAGLAVVAAPVLVPVALAGHVAEERQWAQARDALRQGVEARDPLASFQVLMRMDDGTPALRRQAAQQLLAQPLPPDWAPGRQQAARFLAYRFRAPATAWAADPSDANDWLAAARVAQDPALWAYVRGKDSGLPVNSGYFTHVAETVAYRVLTARQAARARAAANDALPFACDLQGLAPMLAQASPGEGQLARYCAIAEGVWRDSVARPAASPSR